MKFSVITVCRNAEKTIEATLNSVAAQTCPHVEHLVIDGASTDDTCAIVAKHRDRLAHFVSEPDHGIYEAINKGVRLARGDYLYFLNADDQLYDADVLQRVADDLAADPVELLIGDILLVDEQYFSRPALDRAAERIAAWKTKQVFVRRALPQNAGGLAQLKKHVGVDKFFLYHSAIAQQGLFYRRDVLDRCGLFDERYRIVGDYEWALRAFFKFGVKSRRIELTFARYGMTGVSSVDAVRPQHLRERQDAIARYFTPRERFLLDRNVFQILMRNDAFRRWARRVFGWGLP